jgi:hypothetical protein
MCSGILVAFVVCTYAIWRECICSVQAKKRPVLRLNERKKIKHKILIANYISSEK